ncbi:MAG TPA: hypothetical protein VKA60_12280 [Blastocatellia bacterium]|nr:hypothetical protein [Blastocatellia bacterium]
MFIIAAPVGFAVGVIMWYITSRWIASTIFWVEQRYPQLIGTRAIKVSEILVCGLQVFACLALALWIARLMVG